MCPVATTAAAAGSLRDLPAVLDAHGAQGVLLDIGGVLADDVWERLLLDPSSGLAARRGLDVDRVRAAGQALWQRLSRGPGVELEWWAGLEEQLGVSVPGAERDELLRTVRGNPDARPAVEELVASGRPVGLVSNNTAFWAPWQLALAGVESCVDPALTFLSCELGVTKGDEPGLLERAAEHAAGWLLVDDRPDNLARARGLGLVGVQVRFGTAAEGLA